MADSKLSDLTASSALTGSELFYSDNGSADVKVTATQVKTFAVGAGSVSVATGKTLTASNTLTLAGTDSTTMTFPSSSTTVAGLGIANLFTKAQTFQPDSDAQAGTFRRNGSGQSSNIVEIQTEANGFLAGFDKVGLLTLGAASRQTGTLKLAGTTSGVVSLSVADAAGTWTLKLPTTAGTDGYVLKTDGSGNTSWVAQSGGGGTPGGSDTQIQFNDGGSTFGGDADFVWNKTTNLLTLTGLGTGGGANTGGLTLSGGSLTMSGDISANAWTTNGIRYKSVSATLTDLTSSGTVAAAYTNAYGGNTIAASSATTFTDYFTTFINSATAGTNVTITNRWALGLGGNLKLGADASGSNAAGTNVIIGGSRGTGTGAGGSIIFQVAPAGSIGTARNELAAALTLNADRSSTFAGAGAGAGNYVAIFQNGSGSEVASVRGNGNIICSGVNVSGNIIGNTLIIDIANQDVRLVRDATAVLAQRNSTNAQTFNVYGSYTSTTNYQRMVVKTLRESSGALSGASYTSTIALPAYAIPVGVTTRVTTAVTGATTYDVGDGSDNDLWGAAIDVALGSQSRTADFTAVAAVDAAATARTVKLTANGSNFTGGVVEICIHYLTTEAD